jgi:hypothetical protein
MCTLRISDYKDAASETHVLRISLLLEDASPMMFSSVVVVVTAHEVECGPS